MSDTESRHEFQISSYIWFRGYSLMFLTFFFFFIAFSWVRYLIDPRQSTRKHPSSRKGISGGRSARKRTLQPIHLDKGRDRLKYQRSVCRSHSPSISFGTRLTESLVGVSEAFYPSVQSDVLHFMTWIDLVSDQRMFVIPASAILFKCQYCHFQLSAPESWNGESLHS